MANLFGIPQYDPTLDRENMQINAGLVQNLGAQVRNDLTAIQTNRQLKGLAEGLQGLNTNTEDFGQRAVGLMMQYPLAAKSPIGTAAIQQLGAQHKLWQEQQATEAIFGRQVGMLALKDYIDHQPFGSKPMTPDQMRNFLKGGSTSTGGTSTPAVEQPLPVGPGATVTPSIAAAKPGVPGIVAGDNPAAELPPEIGALAASGAMGPAAALGPLAGLGSSAMAPAPTQPGVNNSIPTPATPAPELTVAQKIAKAREDILKVPGITREEGEAALKTYVSRILTPPSAATKGSTYTDNTGRFLARNPDGTYSEAKMDDGTPIRGRVPGTMAPEAAANILADNARQDLDKKERTLDRLHKELASLNMGTGPDFPRDKDGKVTSTDPKDMVAWVPDDKTGSWRQNPVSPSTVKKWKELNDTITRLSAEIQKASGGLPVSRVGAGAAVAAPALRTPPANVVDKAFLESGDDMAKFQEILKSQGYAY